MTIIRKEETTKPCGGGAALAAVAVFLLAAPLCSAAFNILFLLRTIPTIWVYIGIGAVLAASLTANLSGLSKRSSSEDRRAVLPKRAAVLLSVISFVWILSVGVLVVTRLFTP